MAKLQVYLNNTWVELPNCQYEVSQQKIQTEYLMADGSTAVDFIGNRLTLSANFGFIPAATFQALDSAIGNGGAINVKYHNTAGTLVSGYFRFEPITRKAFKSVNGVPTWIQPNTVVATSREVV